MLGSIAYVLKTVIFKLSNLTLSKRQRCHIRDIYNIEREHRNGAQVVPMNLLIHLIR